MSFLRQVGTVAAGVAGGQLILLAATPLLARTFTPAAFGDYAVFLALYFVTLVVACLRLEFAIPIAPDEMVPALAQAALLSSIAVGALAGLLALSGVVSRLNPQAGAALGWLAVCAPFVGLVQTAIFAAIRAGRFRSNAAIRMLQPACFVAIALFAPSLGLVRSHVLAAGVAAAFAAVTLAPLLKPVRLGAMREALARFKSHPLLSLPSTLLDTLSLACPIFVISSAYGTEVLGNYSQLQRLLA
ncbi:MAG: lipopolysaccharide biosynthesis protein, partial [Usitatibacter sp.]